MTSIPETGGGSLTIDRPALYLVATPIGNVGDITLRAIEIVKLVDLALAEDTRHSARLFATYGVTRAFESLHEHNEQQRVDSIIAAILAQRIAVAIVSDAGTPLISDPGFRLVQAAHAAGITVRPVPGASALLAAVTAAALTVDRFSFEGFLPTKSAARRARLTEFLSINHTTVFYEAPHRILETITDMREIFGAQRQLCVARELTKQFETLYRGTLQDVLMQLRNDANAARGEIVIVVGPGLTPEFNPLADRLLAVLVPRMTIRDAVDITSTVFEVPRKLTYQRALAMREKPDVPLDLT